MNDTPVPVVGVLVGLSWGEMKRAANLFVEQGVEHRMTNAVIATDRPFAQIPCALVCIEDFIQFVRFVCRSGNNLSIFKGKGNVIEQGTLISRRRVVANCTVHAVTHRCRKDLSIGNIPLSVARPDGDAFDGKSKVGSR